MRPKYALGLDYGTNSCRSALVDLSDGTVRATSVFRYPSGTDGILLEPSDPNLARQNPQDYIDGAVAIVRGAVRTARKLDRHFRPSDIIGIGIDTTGSTPIPVDRNGTPLGILPKYRKNLDAMAWLWKDHTSHAEAEQITELAARIRPDYLAKCGGVYSSEWFWSKVLHCRRVAPEVFKSTHSFVECCDYIPALLVGQTRPETLRRSICAAGHKAMFCQQWNGLPDVKFLARLSPDLARLRSRLYEKAYTADQPAGHLDGRWAQLLGLHPGTAIAVGAFDAHMGAVGAGIREKVLVKILGTSTCDMMVSSHRRAVADIPGVCGIVDGSILPGYYGIEAGQSAVGDIFLWFVNHLVPDRYGRTPDEKFRRLAESASRQKPGEHGILALDWNNGNRSILVDVRLSGLIVGQSLHTRAHEVYRALIESTAFGALTIIRRIEEYGVPVHEIVACGGLATKNPLLMQIYADVTGRPISVSGSDQTCALGAAIFGAVAAGPTVSGFRDLREVQDTVCRLGPKPYLPQRTHQRTYARMYELYRNLHDAFGTTTWHGQVNQVMKELIALRERQRRPLRGG